MSSLRASAPLVLINVSLGDQATARAPCGCPLGALGWTTHLATIRSHEKLTAGGMTFLDTDLIRVLEEVLPARFGGAPTDYQLVEEEAADGRPRLRLLVHPARRPGRSGTLVDAFLSAIGAGPGGERVMELQWREPQASCPSSGSSADGAVGQDPAPSREGAAASTLTGPPAGPGGVWGTLGGVTGPGRGRHP